MDQASIEKRLKLHEQRRSERLRNEHITRECYDFVNPARGFGFNGEGTFDAATEQSKRARVLSSVSADAAENLTANVVAGATPANAQWFELDVGGSSENDRRWLSDSARFIWENIHSSNFDAEVFDAMFDVVAAGYCGLYVDEDREVGGYTFETWPLHQLFVASSKPGGPVDIVERAHQMTAEQAVSTYGFNNLSERTRDAVMNKPQTMVDFVHIVEPRKLSVQGALLAKNLPIASLVFEKNSKHLVRESGYHEMPVIVPRWSRLPQSAYATGPVASALPDIRLLNKLRANELSATELAIAGMWIAEDDGVLNPKTIKVGPRKVIVANSINSMKELKSGSDFNVAFTAEERLERAIRKRLLADQLQPQDGPAMTATEVHVRVALIRQLLGPVFGRLQAEFLQPLVVRCFGIAYRAGMLGQAPQSLAGKSFHVKYINPMARSQKLEDVTAVQQYVQGIGLQLQVWPEAKDLVDIDAANRLVAEGLGVPKSIVPDSKKVQQLRDGRKQDSQQQQQAMQQQATQQSMNEAMAKRMATAA